MIKQFTSLKVSPPLGDDSYETTVAALKELSDALDYWGKILQRQKKIRHIRTSRKLKSLEEYNKTDSRYYMFMDYCNGGDMKDLMELKQFKVDPRII